VNPDDWEWEFEDGRRTARGSVEPMTESELSTFLREQGTGVLSLAGGEDVYAVPMSFGYDDGRLYFQFGSGEGSRKLELLERTGRATVTTYLVASAEEWASAIVSGPVERVPEDRRETALEAIEANATFPTLGVTGTDSGEIVYELFALDPTDRSGRKGAGYSPTSE